MSTDSKLWWAFGFTALFLTAGIIVLWSFMAHDGANHHHNENIARIQACREKPDFVGCVRGSDKGDD